MNESNINELKNQLSTILSTKIEINNLDYFAESNQIPKGKKVYNIYGSILFVDIRNSTKMLDDNGRKNMVKVYKMFSKLVIKAVEDYGGKVQQFMGDGMLVTFDNLGKKSGHNAISAAISINTYLQESYNSIVPNNLKVQCGIGICTGHIYVTRIGVRGDGKSCQVAFPSAITNYACKLCNNAKGGSILFDNETYNQLSKNLKNICSIVEIKNLGEFYLIKDRTWEIEK